MVIITCDGCGKERKLKANNLCNTCYIKDYRKKDIEKMRDYDKKNYERNKEYYKNYYKLYYPDNKKRYKDLDRKFYLKKLYNLSLEAYSKLFDSQNGECPLCGCDLNSLDRNPSVDHNHKNNKVRGILCQSCNLKLGFIEGDKYQKWLGKAIIYLKNNN